MTARWVVDKVADERDLNIVWQPISLLFKNNPPEDSPYYEAVVKTHHMLRVMESVRSEEGDGPVFNLYWELASRIHNDGDRDFEITFDVRSGDPDYEGIAVASRLATTLDDDTVGFDATP